MKEVEELEMLTQKLMKDMDHPPPVEAATSGVCSFSEQQQDWDCGGLLSLLIPFYSCWQSCVASVGSPCHGPSQLWELWTAFSMWSASPASSVRSSCRGSSSTMWMKSPSVRTAMPWVTGTKAAAEGWACCGCSLLLFLPPFHFTCLV